MALRQNNVPMFKYFWDDLSFVYCDEVIFQNLFRTLAKREQSEMINYYLSNRSTKTLFYSMSYSYRSEFIDNVLQIKGELTNEFNQQVIEEMNHESSNGNSPV